MDLFSSKATGETVLMEWWKGGTARRIDEFCGCTDNGVEVFLIEGDLTHRDTHYEGQAWFRWPGSDVKTSDLSLTTKGGCQIWVKTGHLPMQE